MQVRWEEEDLLQGGPRQSVLKIEKRSPWAGRDIHRSHPHGETQGRDELETLGIKGDLSG